jgi:hypothetical protein
VGSLSYTAKPYHKKTNKQEKSVKEGPNITRNSFSIQNAIDGKKD